MEELIKPEKILFYWLTVLGEGKQEQLSELRGDPRPAVRVEMLVCSTFDGESVEGRRDIQRFVKEALAPVAYPEYAHIAVEEEDGRQRILRKIDPQPDLTENRWMWSVTDDAGVKKEGGQELMGYHSIEKGILNAVVSIPGIIKPLVEFDVQEKRRQETAE